LISVKDDPLLYQRPPNIRLTWEAELARVCAERSESTNRDKPLTQVEAIVGLLILNI